MQIRFEEPADIEAIRALVTTAFANAPHSSGTEAAIVDALRRAGALAVSLVAEDGGEIIGHVAFSPVTINAKPTDWFGLGPVAVRADKQRGGVGQALIRAGLDSLKEQGARGCVVLGDPAYYARFGFCSDSDLHYGDVPAEYFQRLSFENERPTGMVKYHQAFLES
jgi:putative acetyltransferase